MQLPFPTPSTMKCTLRYNYLSRFKANKRVDLSELQGALTQLESAFPIIHKVIRKDKKNRAVAAANEIKEGIMREPSATRECVGRQDIKGSMEYSGNDFNGNPYTVVGYKTDGDYSANMPLADVRTLISGSISDEGTLHNVKRFSFGQIGHIEESSSGRPARGEPLLYILGRNCFCWFSFPYSSLDTLRFFSPNIF